MEDKSFYLSELAFEMLVVSQGAGKVPLPTSGAIKDASQEDVIKEIYSLVSNGIMENDEEKNCFTVDKDLANLLKTVLGSKSVLRVINMRCAHNPLYCYASGENVTLVESNNFHGGIKLSGIAADALGKKLFDYIDITENIKNVSENVEELDMGEGISPSDMLETEPEELKNGFGDTEGCIDMILSENLNTVCRVIVYKKESEHKTAQISRDKFLVSDYTFANFCKATERMTGKK